MRNNKNKNKVGTRRLAPPNYLIICEGKETEPNYFNGLKKKINEKFRDKISIVPGIKVKGTGLNTESIVEYTKKYINKSPQIYGQVWVVFDKDDYTDEQFNNAIRLNLYNSAWSNPNFEVWLLSHFKNVSNSISKNDSLSELKKEFRNSNLGNYYKNDKEIFEKITSNNRLQNAINNSKKMYNQFKDSTKYSSKNPCTTVFMLVKDLNEYLK